MRAIIINNKLVYYVLKIYGKFLNNYAINLNVAQLCHDVDVGLYFDFFSVGVGVCELFDIYLRIMRVLCAPYMETRSFVHRGLQCSWPNLTPDWRGS